MEKFWMVYVKGGDSARIKHLYLDKAQEEAERLARKTGQPVYVLEAVEVCAQEVQPLPPVRWERLLPSPSPSPSSPPNVADWGSAVRPSQW